MKKILSMILALAMVFSLAVPAMAAEDTRTIYFENTDNWSTVNAYAWDAGSNALLGTWPGSEMTKVEGEENIYSIEVPTDAVNMIFNNGSEKTSDLTIPTDGKNLYTYNSGWSTYGSTGDEPTINGNTEGDVTASFAPEIYVSGISATGDTVIYDPETKTHIIVFPVGAESITYHTVFSGKNLAYYRDAANKVRLRETTYRDGSVAQEREFEMSVYNYFSYDEATGNLKIEATPANTAVGLTSVYEYSNDGGRTWQEGSTRVFVQAYSITNSTAADANGSVTVPASAIEGETVELFITASEGYELDTLTVMQGDTPVDVAEDHTFTMPAGDVTVTATFKAAEKAYNINVNESENGTVVATEGGQPVTSAHHNDDVTLVVTPAEGYQLSSLTVKDASGEDVLITDSNTFVMPESDVTVTATFKKVYTITTVFEGKGAVSADKTSAAEDETVTVTFTPDPGYVLFKQNAYDPDNPSKSVELIQSEDAYTFTFQMPAHAVQVAGAFAKDGKAREDLYFNNGGNDDWTNVEAIFYNDLGHYVGRVTLAMAEDGIYALPEDKEIPNLAYKVYFDCGSERTTAMAEIPTDENNMFTLAAVPNENGQYEGTWSVYTPSTPAVTSAEITWGSLSFTYTDGENGAEGTWSNDGTDGAGTVTVKNTGDNTFAAQPVYTAETVYDEIGVRFYNSVKPESPISMGFVLDSDETVTIIMKLFNKPEKAIPAGTKIGTVTIRITEGSPS